MCNRRKGASTTGINKGTERENEGAGEIRVQEGQKEAARSGTAGGHRNKHTQLYILYMEDEGTREIKSMQEGGTEETKEEEAETVMTTTQEQERGIKMGIH